MTPRYIEFRSEDVQEVLLRKPAWAVRWGITILFGVVTLLLLGSWLIRYPEMIKGNIVITTIKPPVRVLNRTSGRLVRLLVADTATVQAGQVLAEIENTTRLENLPALKALTMEMNRFLSNTDHTVQLPAASLTFGDLQAEYNTVIKNYTDYKRLLTDTYNPQRIALLKRQIADYRRLVTVNETQAAINADEFRNAEIKYQADKRLYDEKVYGRLEFLREENAFLQKKKENETYRRTAIENSLTLSEREKQLAELSYESLQKSRSYRDAIQQALSNIDNTLKVWQQTYLMTAPINGKLSYLHELTENQFIRTNDTLFAVIPDSQSLIGNMTFTVQGMGKIQPGQEVLIRLDDYPYQEFGMLRGYVQQIAPTPDRRQYRAIVSLPDGLLTTHTIGKPLRFRPELTGTADIVTDNRRLLEQAFTGLRGLLRKNG